MSVNNEDPRVRRQQPDDLQRDDHGRGHVPQKSKKDLDAELDKALQGLVSGVRPSGPVPADRNGAGR